MVVYHESGSWLLGGYSEITTYSRKFSTEIVCGLKNRENTFTPKVYLAKKYTRDE